MSEGREKLGTEPDDDLDKEPEEEFHKQPDQVPDKHPMEDFRGISRFGFKQAKAFVDLTMKVADRILPQKKDDASDDTKKKDANEGLLRQVLAMEDDDNGLLDLLPTVVIGDQRITICQFPVKIPEGARGYHFNGQYYISRPLHPERQTKEEKDKIKQEQDETEKENKQEQEEQEKRDAFWKKDADYLAFQKRLYEEEWTFETTVKESGLAKYFPPATDHKLTAEMKGAWQAHVLKWNQDEDGRKEATKIKGFAALTFFYANIPYVDMPSIVALLNEHMGKMIHRILFYVHHGDLAKLPFAITSDEHKENLWGGPQLPSAYQHWIDKMYENASWWTGYAAYEFRTGKQHYFDAPPLCLRSIG